MNRALLVFLLAFSAAALAETTVYKHVRPDGTVEFSDSPKSGGAPVQVPDITVYPSAPKGVSPAAKGESKAAPKPVMTYEAIEVTRPANNETVFFDDAGLPVAVNVRPALQEGHTVAVYVDGQLVAKGAGSSFVVKDVFRGSHTVAAEILDQSGKVVVSSLPVSFQLIQHTVRPR